MRGDGRTNMNVTEIDWICIAVPETGIHVVMLHWQLMVVVARLCHTASLQICKGAYKPPGHGQGEEFSLQNKRKCFRTKLPDTNSEHRQMMQIWPPDKGSKRSVAPPCPGKAWRMGQLWGPGSTCSRKPRSLSPWHQSVALLMGS